MKLIAEKPATVDKAGDAGLTLEGASPAPVVITEQEVLLSTAAAMPAEQPKTARR
ncbi:MAG: hypothetical protein JWR32_6654 [Mycobacterium sp.]|jgi:hypothetical protein|nr:hypothetical protein [Mycobacterium sp.]